MEVNKVIMVSSNSILDVKIQCVVPPPRALRSIVKHPRKMPKLPGRNWLGTLQDKEAMSCLEVTGRSHTPGELQSRVRSC